MLFVSNCGRRTSGLTKPKKPNRLPSCLVLTAFAFFELVRFDLLLMLGDFSRLRDRVCRFPLAAGAYNDATELLCRAVDIASVCYWKQILCLQRSAATACVLRKFGVPARLVIGVQPLPFLAHAWVEVEGVVVNDKPYVREIYRILDEC